MSQEILKQWDVQHACTLPPKMSCRLDANDLPRNCILGTWVSILCATVEWMTIRVLIPLQVKITFYLTKASQACVNIHMNIKINLYPEHIGLNSSGLDSRGSLSSQLTNREMFDNLPCRKLIFWQNFSGKSVPGKKTLMSN